MGRDSQPSSVLPTIDELVLATAGVEESQVLQDDDGGPPIKKVQLKCRTGTPIKYGYAPGGPYVTLGTNETYWQDGLDARHITLYVVGTIDGQVAEIETWV